MKIAIGTHQLRGYPQNEPGIPDEKMRKNLFAWAQRAEFDGIEIADWWINFSITPRRVLREIKQEIEDHGLEVAGFNCLRRCVTHPDVASQNVDALKGAIEAAEILRPNVISISLSLDPSVTNTEPDRVKGLPVSPGGGLEADPGEFETAARILSELASQAAAIGVTVALELHHCSIADTSSRLLRVLELAGNDNLRANPDLTNLYWAYDVPEEPWFEAVEALASHTGFWHVKNVKRIHIPELQRSWTVHAPLDDGDIDYRWALGRMTEAGFDGYLSIEGAGPGDLLSFAERGKNYLSTLRGDSQPGLGLRVH